MEQAIVAIFMQFTAWHGDVETRVERVDRMGIIAKAIVGASGQNLEVVAFLVMTAKKESDLALHIHRGNCGKHPKSPEGECDSGKAGTPWQIQHGAWLPKRRWQKMLGADLKSTTLAAQYAALIYRKAKNFCRSNIGAISLYATGTRCFWAGARHRLFTMRRVKHRLRF